MVFAKRKNYWKIANDANAFNLILTSRFRGENVIETPLAFVIEEQKKSHWRVISMKIHFVEY